MLGPEGVLPLGAASAELIRQPLLILRQFLQVVFPRTSFRLFRASFAFRLASARKEEE